jgi:hypothetical protein
VECKLRSINFSRVLDSKRAFQPAFRVTGISDDMNSHSTEVIVISFGIPWNVAKNFVFIWKNLGVLATYLGALMTILGAQMTQMGMPMPSLRALVTRLEAS